MNMRPVLLLSLLPAVVLAADAKQPHPHQGVLAPYTGGPPTVELDAKDLQRLSEGKAVRKQVRTANGGRGMAIQDVQAEVATVWDRITDYPAYPRMVDSVKSCNIYEKKNEHIKARFIIGGYGMSIEYFIDHVFRPEKGYMTWTLDYSRKSDLDESVGYWFVQPVAGRPGWTRVYYSVAVQVSGWIPGFIEDILVEEGLERATSWVKRESERAQRTKK